MLKEYRQDTKRIINNDPKITEYILEHERICNELKALNELYIPYKIIYWIEFIFISLAFVYLVVVFFYVVTTLITL